jgi:pimeloyl-ACP methyl ester carboxylesterase
MAKVDKFYFVENGEGEKKVLFIHGAGGSHQNWILQIKNPPKGFTYIALDLPGHGKSEGSYREKVEDYAEDIIEFVEKRGIEPFAMVGHSLGGCIAISAYLKGLKVKGLVLVSSALKLWGARAFNTPPDRYRICDSLFYDWRLRAQCKSGNIGLFNQDFEVLRADMKAAENCDLRGFADKINVPVLIVYGFFDRMLPAWAIDETYYLLKGRSRKVGLEAAHMPMVERAEEFNLILSDFVAGLE